MKEKDTLHLWLKKIDPEHKPVIDQLLKAFRFSGTRTFERGEPTDFRMAVSYLCSHLEQDPEVFLTMLNKLIRHHAQMRVLTKILKHIHAKYEVAPLTQGEVKSKLRSVYDWTENRFDDG